MFCALMCSVLWLTGCGDVDVSAPVTQPTVLLGESGELQVSMVESFDRDYYSVDELAGMVREELSSYEGVTLNYTGMAEDGSGNVVVTLDFADDAACGSYFDSTVFYGTVREALEAGYDPGSNLVSVKTGEAITADQLSRLSDRYLLILGWQAEIRSPKKVLYHSGNASLTEAGFVDGVAEGDDPGLIYVIVDMK